MAQAEPPLSVGGTPLDLMDGANGKIEGDFFDPHR